MKAARVIDGEEMDIGQFGQKGKPKIATKLKAIDLLNQMEGVYITKIESKQASIVELVIVTTDMVDGKLVEGTPDITPVG